LDTGCDTTMATKRSKKELEISCNSYTNVHLCTHNNDTMHAAFKIDLNVAGVYSKQKYLLKVVICIDNIATHRNPVKSDFVRIKDIAGFSDLNLPIVQND